MEKCGETKWILDSLPDFGLIIEKAAKEEEKYDIKVDFSFPGWLMNNDCVTIRKLGVGEWRWLLLMFNYVVDNSQAVERLAIPCARIKSKRASGESLVGCLEMFWQKRWIIRRKWGKNRQKMIKSFPRMEWETVWRTRGCGLNFPCGLDSSSCVHERDTVPLSRAQPTNDRNNCHNLRNMVGTHFFIGRHLIN